MTEMKYSIDWDCVKKELLDKEKIRSVKNNTRIIEHANAYLTKAESLVSPMGFSLEKNIINIHPDSIEIEGGITLSIKSLSSYIKGAEAVNIFVVTIGEDLENTASRLMAGDETLEGYLLDRIGSFAVESLAQNFEEKLRAHYLENAKSISMRFSPGYCDWPIEEQFKLDKIIDFSRAGIHLTKSCMMVPKKSISAIVGIGPKGKFAAERKSPCLICDKKNCDYKR